MLFVYEAKNSKGETIKGEETADSKLILYKRLQEHNMMLLNATEKKSSGLFSKEGISLLKRVSVHQRIVFARNLAVMMNAGLPLSRALLIMTKQTRNMYFKSILEAIENSIRSGKTFSESLKAYPKVFPHLFVAMVGAGEESGKLTEALQVIADQTEKNYLLLKKVKGALIYPGVIITAMLGIAIFMLVYIVPTLTSTFKELNVDLPSSTQFIIWLSESLKNNFILSVVTVIAAIAGFIFLMKSEKGKMAFNYVILKFPIIGNLVKQINAARTARTLSSLLSSGVSVVESLRITGDVLQNHYYKKVLKEAQKQVQVGAPISAVFTKAQDVYPIYVGEMMAVGEETGEIGPMLQKVAQFFEEEVEQQTKDMSTIIEPFLMLIVGAGVGFFALSMIAPMYSLVDAI